MAALAMTSRKELDSLTAKPVPPFPMEDCRAGRLEAVRTLLASHQLVRCIVAPAFATVRARPRTDAHSW